MKTWSSLTVSRALTRSTIRGPEVYVVVVHSPAPRQLMPVGRAGLPAKENRMKEAMMVVRYRNFCILLGLVKESD